MLRLGKEFTKEERDNRVDEVLNFVGYSFLPRHACSPSFLLAQFDQIREHHHWYYRHCQRFIGRWKASFDIRDRGKSNLSIFTEARSLLNRIWIDSQWSSIVVLRRTHVRSRLVYGVHRHSSDAQTRRSRQNNRLYHSSALIRDLLSLRQVNLIDLCFARWSTRVLLYR